MLFTVAVVLFVAWFLGFGVLHITGAMIHLLLILAIISIAWQLVRGRRSNTI